MNDLTTHESKDTVVWDNKEKLTLMRKTIAAGVTDDEFELFIAMAKSSGLDPFNRQIYAVSREVSIKDDNGKFVKQKKMTVQTGIDGYRLIADRTGKHMGTEGPFFEMGDKYPESAKVIVKKLVQGHVVNFESTCYWSEYAPIYDGKVGGMWSKMPRTMLGKVAEALALRRAFPANLSGLYTSEEMSQADHVEVKPEPRKVANTNQYAQLERESLAEIQEVILEVKESNSEKSEMINALAEEVAANGAEAFREWFKELPKPSKDMLKPHLNKCKEIAAKFDNKGDK